MLMLQIAGGIVIAFVGLGLLFGTQAGQKVVLFIVIAAMAAFLAGLALVAYLFVFDDLPAWLLWLAVAWTVALPSISEWNSHDADVRHRNAMSIQHRSQWILGHDWFHKPNDQLGGLKPADIAWEHKGARRLEELLKRGPS